MTRGKQGNKWPVLGDFLSCSLVLFWRRLWRLEGCGVGPWSSGFTLVGAGAVLYLPSALGDGSCTLGLLEGYLI